MQLFFMLLKLLLVALSIGNNKTLVLYSIDDDSIHE